MSDAPRGPINCAAEAEPPRVEPPEECHIHSRGSQQTDAQTTDSSTMLYRIYIYLRPSNHQIKRGTRTQRYRETKKYPIFSGRQESV